MTASSAGMAVIAAPSIRPAGLLTASNARTVNALVRLSIPPAALSRPVTVGSARRHGIVRPASRVACALLAAACTHPLKPDPHYVLGKPYQVGSVWYYPRDSFDFDETGIAAIIENDAPRLTADGEVFDQTILAAAHSTLQLPAIARLTNLENGREITIRLNDRSSGNPGRLVEVTRRAAALLAFPAAGLARVRLRLLPAESHAAAQSVPGAPSLALASAPREVVELAELPPPAGIRQGGRAGVHASVAAAAEPAPPPAPPLRLPETVIQTTPQPGRLMLRLDTFDTYQYAAVQCAKLGPGAAHIVPLHEGRTRRFQVEAGPLPTIASADALLAQALAAGIPDARIVVD